jgi:hypothetical protein
MKAISSKFLPKLLGSSRNGDKSNYRTDTGTGTGTGTRSGGSIGSRKPRIRHLLTKSDSHTKASSYSSKGGDGYEMADPLSGPPVNVSAGDSFDMRKYKRRADSPSIMISDDDDVSGIVKRTDITIGYTMDPSEAGNSRSHENRPASVDSLV